MLTAPAYPPFAAAEELEAHLGDPRDPRTLFSFAACERLDEAELFPDAICADLERWGLHHYYVPAEFGGRLRSFEHALHLLRVVARRDLTVAIGHGKTFLGAVSAWVGHDPELAHRIAAEVIAGTPISWGLTERAHGSDLLTNEVRGVRSGDEWRVSGEKWLINNATRGQITAVLARTSAEGGARGFDVLFVDKRDLPEAAYTPVPKEYTLGIRGADISGIRYHDAVVPERARVGAPGAGVEIVLRGLQLTRTMCAGLALGGGEHALRIAIGTLRDRQTPEVRQRMVAAYADHLLNEVVATVAARCAHHVPGEMSLVSSVAKYLVPLRTDALIRSLGEVLGLDALVAGTFEKVARDTRLVDLFDGNRIVNLNAIVTQFPLLVNAWSRPVDPELGRALFAVGTDCPEFAPRKLKLISTKGVSVVRALPDAVARCDELGHALPAVPALAAAAERLRADMAALPPATVRVPVGHFAVAERFALVFAGAAAVQTWLAAGDADSTWLEVVLHRVLAALGEDVEPPGEDVTTRLLTRLLDQERNGRMLSLWSCRLAESGLL